MSSRLIHIDVEKGSTGLVYATSPDLRGLLVAKPDLTALVSDIPRAIEEIFAIKGEEVSAVKVESEDPMSPWMAVPIPK